MSDQGELFRHEPYEMPRVRNSDPETSHEAVHSMKKDSVQKLDAVILKTIRDAADGLTSHELAERMRKELVSVSPRLRPLTRMGFVKDSGERRRHPHSGRRAIVWKLTA